MPLATCPPISELEQLFQGNPTDASAALVEQHLQECSACLATLKELLGTKDTVSGAFAGPDTLHDAAAQPSVQELMAKLEKLKPVAETASDTAAFVTPSSGSPISGTEGDAPADEEEEFTVTQIGQYQLVKKLGVGGMGMVYEALDTHLERTVALKVMRPSLAKNASSRKRFLQEARSAAKIQHDHIVSIFQVGEDQGIPFLAMQLLEGVSLADLLKRQGSLKPSQVIRLGLQIAEGLAAAHGRGLIHRDIKPGNIWIEPVRGGRVKILDFGLARLEKGSAQLTQSGMIVGTPAYMAPEQARGEKNVDARVDLFSLGCVLYLMSTGVMPFAGNDPVGVLMAVQMQEPPPPCKLNPEVPQAFSDLIMKLLAKDPGERLAPTNEVVKALQALERGQASGGGTGELAAAITAVGQPSSATAPVEPTNPFANLSEVGSGLARLEFSKGVPTAPDALPRPSKTQGVLPRRRRLALAAVAAGFLVLMAAGVFGIIRISTPEGDYVIHTDDPDFSFSVSKGAVTLNDKKSKRVYTMKVLREIDGAFELDVTDVGGDLSFKTKEFTIKRGQQIALKAHFERKQPAAQGTAIPPAAVATKLAPSPFDALRREDIPPYELAMAGGGDANQAPPELVAVLGDSRLRHWSSVQSIVFTPDGKSLITSSQDQTAKIWDLATGRQKQVLQTYDPANRSIYLARSQDGKTLASMTNELIKVWDLPSGKERHELKVGSGRGGSLSKDGSLLLVGEGNWVALIELSTGKIRELLKGHKGRIHAHALSPDGSLMAAGDRDHVLKLYTVADDKELFELKGHKDLINSLVFSPDGRTLASGAPDGLKVWDVQTGKERRSVPGQLATYVVAYSADGKHLAAGSIWAGKIQVWDTDHFKELPALTVTGIHNRVDAIAFSPDGKTLAAGMLNGIIKMWDLATGKERFNFPGHQGYITSLAVAPSGKLVATGSSDASVRMVDVPSLQERFRFQADGSMVHAVTFSPDSQRLIAGTGSGGKLDYFQVLAWGLDGGKLEHIFYRHGNMLLSVAVSPDGKTLASGDIEGVVKLWDLPAGMKHDEVITHKARLILKGPAGAVASLAFSPDGAMLAIGSNDQKISLWDMASGKERRAFQNKSQGGGEVRSLAFSPDGSLLAAGAALFSGADTKVWEVATGEEYTRVPGESPAVAFGRDHKLYTAGNKGVVQVWDLTKQGAKRLEKQIRLGPPGGFIEQLVLSPDGRHLLTRNWNGTTYVLRLTPSPQPTAAEQPATKFTNSLGMEFALVPKGKALLGGGGGKPGTTAVEFKDDFYLGVYEVTQEEWEKVIGAHRSIFSRIGASSDVVKDIADAELKRFPVDNISWNEAQQFVAKLNERDPQPGWIYRLPTEPEWEYVCRGGPQGSPAESAFHFHVAVPTQLLSPQQANYQHEKSLKRTCKVGSYPPNRLGLYDMHGNVWEFCQEDLGEKNGISWRAMRGGAWKFDAEFCRAARNFLTGAPILADGHGLRLARVPVGK